MADITITVAEARAPAPGRKLGVVRDTTGKTWYIDPNDLTSVVQGGTYVIQQYDTFRTQDGKTLYTIKRYQTVVGGNGGQRMAPQQRSYGQPAPGSSHPSPPPNDNERRMDIFICGAFNNMLSNPNVQPADLQMMDMIDILNKLKGAWLGVFGPSPLPQRGAQQHSPPPQHRNEDMGGDEIPF